MKKIDYLLKFNKFISGAKRAIKSDKTKDAREYLDKASELLNNKKSQEFTLNYIQESELQFKYKNLEISYANIISQKVEDVSEEKCNHSKNGKCYHSDSRGGLLCSGTYLEKSKCMEFAEVG